MIENKTGIPWEDRPKDCNDVIWRSAKNPILTRENAKDANSIFNSAVVPFKDGYAGVFRIDDKSRILRLRVGFSTDGITWDISDNALEMIDENGTKYMVKGYDPRVCFIEDRYYVSYCNCVDGPTVGIAYTFDFVDFYDVGNAFLPFNRN
ncbi:MAG: glycosidase, partial [Oscillospiraceae bacterium]